MDAMQKQDAYIKFIIDGLPKINATFYKQALRMFKQIEKHHGYVEEFNVETNPDCWLPDNRMVGSIVQQFLSRISEQHSEHLSEFSNIGIIEATKQVYNEKFV